LRLYLTIIGETETEK
jgi:hypothetical protein